MNFSITERILKAKSLSENQQIIKSKKKPESSPIYVLSMEELSFLSYYYTSSKESTINDIKKVLPFIEEPEMQQLAEQVIQKIYLIQHPEYLNLDFGQALSVS